MLKFFFISFVFFVTFGCTSFLCFTNLFQLLNKNKILSYCCTYFFGFFCFFAFS
jgi:hypothetical protein